MKRLYPEDHRRSGYQHTMRVPGPFASDEQPLRLWIIAAPIVLALAIVMVAV